MIPKITELISKLPIHSLALETDFIKRGDYKIDPVSFLVSFFVMVSTKDFSLPEWAKTLSIYLQQTISSQALHKKLTFRHVRFAERFLELAVVYSMSNTPKDYRGLLDSFNDVYVTDSSCLSMPKILNEVFPGSHSKTGDAATAKIQLTLELKSDIMCKIDIKSFRDNDQSYAFDILDVASKGDLVIRDLGYLVMGCLTAMTEAGISFISRLRIGIHVFDNQGVKMDLLQRLSAAFANGAEWVDWEVKLSNKQVPVRLIAMKTPKEIVETRVDKAKNDRHSKSNHSKEYYEMQSYTILITNVDKTVLKPHQVLPIYALRWRIECIFKCWKSHMNLQNIFIGKKYNNTAKPYILLLLMLGWISLYHNLVFTPLKSLFRTKNNVPNVSLYKITNLILRYGEALKSKNISEQFILEFIRYYGTYQNKKGKNTYLEKLHMLN